MTCDLRVELRASKYSKAVLSYIFRTFDSSKQDRRQRKELSSLFD